MRIVACYVDSFCETQLKTEACGHTPCSPPFPSSLPYHESVRRGGSYPATYLSLPKTSFRVTARASCAGGRRDVGAFLTKLLLVARTRLKSRAKLEAENIVLRQQVIVLSRKISSRVRLRNIDRLIFTWLFDASPRF